MSFERSVKIGLALEQGITSLWESPSSDAVNGINKKKSYGWNHLEYNIYCYVYKIGLINLFMF